MSGQILTIVQICPLERYIGGREEIPPESN